MHAERAAKSSAYVRDGRCAIQLTRFPSAAVGKDVSVFRVAREEEGGEGGGGSEGERWGRERERERTGECNSY